MKLPMVGRHIIVGAIACGMALLVVLQYTSSPEAYSQGGKAAKADEQAKRKREKQKRRNESFDRVVKKKLLEHRVPFDPELLRGPRGANRIRPYLNQIPEMQHVRFMPKKFKGLIMAHTLHLESATELEEETVIIARNVVFEGCGSTIKGQNDLFLYILDSAISRTPISKLQQKDPRSDYQRVSYSNKAGGLSLPTGVNLVYTKAGYAYLDEAWS